MVSLSGLTFNTLRPRQNGRHFTDDIFNCIFLNENVRISIKISLKFVPKGPINNIPALVQIMAWRRAIIWTNDGLFTDAYMRHSASTGTFFFFKISFHFLMFIHYKCHILVWNWSNTMNISSALWVLMSWCFSTRASVATVLSMHPCVSSCLGVNAKET